MIESSYQLLIQLLQENDIPPDKLKEVLNNFCLTIEEFLKVIKKEEDEAIYIVLKETVSAVESFSHLLEFINNFTNANLR